MIDICIPVFMNYSLLAMQIDHWTKIANRDEYRILVCDNTPVAHRQIISQEILDSIDKLSFLDLAPQTMDGISHGTAIDLLVASTESSIICVQDSDYFWLKPGILQDIHAMFDNGMVAVGTEGYDFSVGGWNDYNTEMPHRAGYLAPICFSIFITQELACSDTWVVTLDDIRVKREIPTGWRVRNKIIDGKLPCHVYRGFKYPENDYNDGPVHYGTPELPVGMHFLKGSGSFIGETHVIPSILEKGLSKWKEKES